MNFLNRYFVFLDSMEVFICIIHVMYKCTYLLIMATESKWVENRQKYENC